MKWKVMQKLIVAMEHNVTGLLKFFDIILFIFMRIFKENQPWTSGTIFS
jgi:hypothetical protein